MLVDEESQPHIVNIYTTLAATPTRSNRAFFGTLALDSLLLTLNPPTSSSSSSWMELLNNTLDPHSF